jgi:chorismate-pyruvate lyase
VTRGDPVLGSTSGSTKIAVAAAVVVILATLAPVVLMSDAFSIAQLAVLALGTIVLGVVLRRDPAVERRSIGTVVILIGVAGLGLAGVLFLAARGY